MAKVYRSPSMYRPLSIILFAAVLLISGEASANPEVPDNNPPPVLRGTPVTVPKVPRRPGGGTRHPESYVLPNVQILSPGIIYQDAQFSIENQESLDFEALQNRPSILEVEGTSY